MHESEKRMAAVQRGEGELKPIKVKLKSGQCVFAGELLYLCVRTQRTDENLQQ